MTDKYIVTVTLGGLLTLVKSSRIMCFVMELYSGSTHLLKKKFSGCSVFFSSNSLLFDPFVHLKNQIRGFLLNGLLNS